MFAARECSLELKWPGPVAFPRAFGRYLGMLQTAGAHAALEKRVLCSPARASESSVARGFDNLLLPNLVASNSFCPPCNFSVVRMARSDP